MATKSPRYGTNPPRKTTTASSTASGNAEHTRGRSRTPPPGRPTGWPCREGTHRPARARPGCWPRSARASLAGSPAAAMPDACSPSRSTKKVRNTVRMPTVALPPRRPRARRSRSDPRPNAIGRKLDPCSGFGWKPQARQARREAHPGRSAWRAACPAHWRAKASSRRKTHAEDDQHGSRRDAADALVIDHPRPRRLRINGATVAAHDHATTGSMR